MSDWDADEWLLLLLFVGLPALGMVCGTLYAIANLFT